MTWFRELGNRFRKDSSSEKRRTFDLYKDRATKKDEKSKDSTSNIPNDRKSQQRLKDDQWSQWRRNADAQLESHWEKVLEGKKSKDSTSNIPDDRKSQWNSGEDINVDKSIIQPHGKDLAKQSVETWRRKEEEYSKPYNSRIRWEADIDQDKSIIQSSKGNKAIKKIKEKESAHIVIPEGGSSSKGIGIESDNGKRTVDIGHENVKQSLEEKSRVDGISEEKKEQINQEGVERYPEYIRNMSPQDREKFFQKGAKLQEGFIKNCLELEDTSEYKEQQQKFNKWAHKKIKEDGNKDLLIGVYKEDLSDGEYLNVKKLIIKEELTYDENQIPKTFLTIKNKIKEFIEDVKEKERKGDPTYQKFRELVESSLAIKYHNEGFIADGRFVNRFSIPQEDGSAVKATYFSQDPDEIDDTTFDAVHNVITKAVKSYIDKPSGRERKVHGVSAHEDQDKAASYPKQLFDLNASWKGI